MQYDVVNDSRGQTKRRKKSYLENLEIDQLIHYYGEKADTKSMSNQNRHIQIE